MGQVRDKRKFRRYSAKERAFALLKPYCDKLGQILDISEGGLSFEYLEVGGGIDIRDTQTAIDIIMTHEAFYLSQIPCEIVYDSPISSESPNIVHGVECRRCGLRFEALDPEQRQALGLFLEKHIFSN